MQCHIPVSFGEVVDKITILNIKLIKVKSKKQKNNIEYELEQLDQYQKLNDEFYLDMRLKLFNVNYTLWHLEDKIRIKSKAQDFDQEYIEIAEQIHKSNDQRYQIKQEINQHYQSDIQEEKIY